MLGYTVITVMKFKRRSWLKYNLGELFDSRCGKALRTIIMFVCQGIKMAKSKYTVITPLVLKT